jgi:hypothetical protein
MDTITEGLTILLAAVPTQSVTVAANGQHATISANASKKRRQISSLRPSGSWCLRRGDASTHTTASAARVPRYIVAAVGDGAPVVVAFAIPGVESIFHPPSDLMRLTMLTRDAISLLQSVSNGQQERQQIDGNYRKQKGWVEAGILRLSASGAFSGRA